MKNTKIEWADNTINWFVGCTKISSGCANCYMFRLEERFGRNPTVVRKTDWRVKERELKKWEPSIIFVNSMSDTFHKDVSEEDLDYMFNTMLEYDKHKYMILTKRSERMASFVQNKQFEKNFIFGVTVENNASLSRLEDLKSVKISTGCTTFVSFEPLLEEINIDWVPADLAIVGGESGPNHRIMKHEWVDKIYEACRKSGASFFFKQWGGNTKCKCHGAWGCRLYKNQTWNEFPLTEKEIEE